MSFMCMIYGIIMVLPFEISDSIFDFDSPFLSLSSCVEFGGARQIWQILWVVRYKIIPFIDVSGIWESLFIIPRQQTCASGFSADNVKYL